MTTTPAPAPSTVLRRRLLTRIAPLVTVEVTLAVGIVVALRSGASFGDVLPLLLGAVFLGLLLPVLMIDALRVAAPVTGRGGFAAAGAAGSDRASDGWSPDGTWSDGGWSDSGWSSGDSGCSSGDSGSSGGGSDGGCGGSW